MGLLLPILMLLNGFNASASSRCEQLFNNLTVVFPAGKTPQSLSAFDNHFQKSAEEGSVILYRGQRRLTLTLPSVMARREGLQASIDFLNQSISSKEQQLQKEKEWLAKMIRENGQNPTYATIYSRKQKELDSLTAVDLVTIEHSQIFNADSSFVSTSSSINIAGGNYQGGYHNRYIYVLVVPKDIPIKTFAARKKKNADDPITAEMEYSIPHDASKFILGVVDTETGKFISKNEIQNRLSE